MDRPPFPAGPFDDATALPEHRAKLIAQLDAFPAKLRGVVASLDEATLDRKYINWSIRQIISHLADSHTHALLRVKLALTRMHPTIAPYDETATAELIDSKRGPIEPALLILQGTHARAIQLFNEMSDADFALAFFHPERNASVKLNEMLAYYAWHGEHHLAQIRLVIKDAAA